MLYSFALLYVRLQNVIVFVSLGSPKEINWIRILFQKVHHAFSYICLGSAFCIELMINLVDSIFFVFFCSSLLVQRTVMMSKKEVV